jgi:hypothetical protein
MLRLSCHAAALLAVVAVGGCDGNGENVARVGNREITAKQLEAGIEHIVEELQREGREVAEEGSPGFSRLRAQVLDLLVYREQIEQAGARTGVHVAEEEVERRLAQSGEAEKEGEEGEAFLEAAVRTQLVLEAVARSLAMNISVSEDEIAAYYRSHAELFRTPSRTLVEATEAIRSELLATRRNKALHNWIAQARRTVPVRYEPGYGPPA